MTTIIVPLGPASTDVARFGGKAAGLGMLLGFGHRVPGGFVIAADALDETLEALGMAQVVGRLDRSMADGDPDLSAAETIRDALLNGEMPSELVSMVLRAADVLGDSPLIARSSAAVEDSTAHSYAGMFESIRVASPAGLAEAIRKVWASAFAPRALLYAVASGVARAPVMAVVVQRHVAAERSGVMFTTFPGPDGERATLVEHVAGTSERLVAGEVTPERLWLSSGSAASDPLLDTRHSSELARLAVRLEEELGRPQDVEWCLLDDEIHLVQSRPITASFEFTDQSPPAAEAGPVLLTGTGASPGIGSGPTHVAFNIEQALALESGQVLVTTMTNPDMVVAMRKSAAIVTDVGGMICHAAIVSRELQLPCVVGTGKATQVLTEGHVITVDGGRGVVLDGEVDLGEAAGPLVGADRLWELWRAAASPGLVPVVSTLALVSSAPGDVARITYSVDIDARAGEDGLWRSFAGDIGRVLDDRLEELEGAAPTGIELSVSTDGGVPLDELRAASDRRGVTVAAPDPLVEAVPFASSLAGSDEARAGVGPAEETIGRLMNPANNPGPAPQVRQGPMPEPSSRSRWWDFLDDYGRYHQEFDTASDRGMYPWIEIRSEVLTSPLLKSLVLPGFEMVPRALGFEGMPPMHTKWFRARFHVRADTFGPTWARLVQSTWDSGFMEEFLRKVRRSYVELGEAVKPFPASPAEASELAATEILDLLAGWWPRWTEFFALCLFIQAQGEAILYPVIDETVASNLADLGPAPGGSRWPSTTELVAPTTPVLSGDYMASLQRVREALERSGQDNTEEALAAIGAGREPELGAAVDEHLREWHWMRDRDLLFEPWDTPERVIETAFATGSHMSVPYRDNLAANLLALSIHADLSARSGRGSVLRHGVRFLQDLNVERENHHILWLKYSYPLRTVVLEVERRMVEAGVITAGSVFFLQAPELIEWLSGGSKSDADIGALALQRRRAYRHEAKLEEIDPATLYEEDDYF